VKLKIPNTYVIISFIILVCAIATWVVPGGQYVNDDAGLHYENVDAVPQTWQIFSAIYYGFKQQAGIILFILVVSGAFWIVNGTGAVAMGIKSFLSSVKTRGGKTDNMILASIIVLFSLFGGIFGMSEECIPFVAISVPLAITMGYDSIVGLLMVYAAAHVGFSGAFLNPFTIGVAQGMAELELFSGMGYRLLCWTVLTTILIVFTLSYASKIRKNPKASIMYDLDSGRRAQAVSPQTQECFRNKAQVVSFILAFGTILAFTISYADGCSISIGGNDAPAPYLLWIVAALFALVSIPAMLKSVHFFVLTLLGFTVIYLIIGVLCFGWYLPEITALFLALGILSGIASGRSANKIAEEFISGAKDVLSAALVVGLASGIIVILKDGRILDSILHSLESGLDGSSKTAALSLMYGIQTLINLVIPSATAKAAITIPIMAPFSDLIGVSRQAMVLAFQFGDGFTNMITPTSGVLIAALGMAGIPYERWVKWVWKFILCLIVVGFILLLPTIFLNLSGF